jgi:hypothetical protein
MLAWRNPRNLERFRALGTQQILEGIIAAPLGTLDDQCRLRAVLALKQFATPVEGDVNLPSPPETPLHTNHQLEERSDLNNFR